MLFTGTTILDAIRSTADPATSIVFSENPDADFVKSNNFSYAIVVVGEPPYAETAGDSLNLTIAEPGPSTIRAVCGPVKCAVIVISGRPVVIEPYLPSMDALVAAWLPGSEGQGVADVLFGDFGFTGKLPRTWFKSVDQLPMNVGDRNYDPLEELSIVIVVDGDIISWSWSSQPRGFHTCAVRICRGQLSSRDARVSRKFRYKPQRHKFVPTTWGPCCFHVSRGGKGVIPVVAVSVRLLWFSISPKASEIAGGHLAGKRRGLKPSRMARKPVHRPLPPPPAKPALSATGRRPRAMMAKEPAKRRASLAEVAGATTAGFAALCCCCPCGLIHLLITVVLKLPLGLVRRALRLRRNRWAASTRPEAGVFRGDDDDFSLCHGVLLSRSSFNEPYPAESPSPELAELEREMLAKFHGAGFWRSLSQR
ncbi:hypothetical protein B296_00053198 [Ensete ventricosum]|uniref:Glycoside hydrolase family 3 C-terminal domain-containing protein n=1 Tax=Ensete ventricosum TaxID=4639 RepID=A0A426Y991_ENSVE|nr:hypothetical protein B296_00053198 [Ensete ventricosum]